MLPHNVATLDISCSHFVGRQLTQMLSEQSFSPAYTGVALTVAEALGLEAGVQAPRFSVAYLCHVTSKPSHVITSDGAMSTALLLEYMDLSTVTIGVLKSLYGNFIPRRLYNSCTSVFDQHRVAGPLIPSEHHR